MVLKEFLELRRDKRMMAMIIALPLLLLVIFGYAASFNVDSLRTEVVGPQARQVAARYRYRPRWKRSAITWSAISGWARNATWPSPLPWPITPNC
ncbi:hypothetical protein [Nocardia albiluteola]|uniref:hypothetical protein n=1 Tax=Nocardia albiluteola TaxID=2842303 RepID=UPI0035577C13